MGKRAPDGRRTTDAECLPTPLADLAKDGRRFGGAVFVEERYERNSSALAGFRGNVRVELKCGGGGCQACNMLGNRRNLRDGTFRTREPQHGGRMQGQSIFTVIRHRHGDVDSFLRNGRQRAVQEI